MFVEKSSHYCTVLPYDYNNIMERSAPHEIDWFDSFDQFIFCTLCKDPCSTRQIRQVVIYICPLIWLNTILYTRQSLLLHSIFIMQRSRRRQILLLCKDPCTRLQIWRDIYTRRPSLLASTAQYFLWQNPPIWPVNYTCQSLLLHSIFVMQRSLHIIC